MSARGLAVPLAAAALLALAAGIARAEYVQQGKLLVFFDAGIAPKSLPRDQLAPVKVGFAGSFEDLEGRDAPALQTMTLRLARGGVIDSQGLPRCSKQRLAQTSSQLALAACRRALVGRGVVGSAIRFPDGKRRRYSSQLLLFNAGRDVLMHIYTREPVEGTFVVPLKIRKAGGRFATVLSARFPRLAAGYGYLTGFRMTLQREFRHHGRKRSYLLASCAAPRGLNRVAFELARVEFRFAAATTVRSSSINVCRVKG
ncbi:MAG: hypothetical protein WDZ46_09775 [Solirubrobacterales bacterium]